MFKVNNKDTRTCKCRLGMFELKALYHMSLTNVCKIFFCNTRKHGGKQPPSVFLMFPFKTLSFLFGLYFFKKMSTRVSPIEFFFSAMHCTSKFLGGFESCLNFSLTKQCSFQNRKSFFLRLHFSQVISEVEFCLFAFTVK